MYCVRGEGEVCGTYSKYGGIIGHLRRLRRAVLLGRREDGQVFDIAATEDDAFVDGFRAGDLERGIALAAFSAMAFNVLQRDGGRLTVDGLEGADVSASC